MNRFFAMLTACALCLAGMQFSTAAASGVENENGFNYYIEDDAVTIIGYTGEDPAVVVPETIAGYPVTQIGNIAFQENLTITSVVLPETIEAIGFSAFSRCKNLETINFPDRLRSIDAYAFTTCHSLKSIDLNQVESLGMNAFQLCIALEEITVPGTIKNIPDHAFHGCHSVTSLTFEEGVETIAENAALNLYSLIEVTIPESVTSIGEHAVGYTYYSPDYTRVSTIVCGSSGSAAERYALDNGFDFLSVPLGLGDLNGDSVADANDAAMVLVAAAARGAGAPSGLLTVQETAADADKSGDYDASDAAYILEYAAKAALGGMGSFEAYMAAR
ncbi:MAG: leucine-rich repeat protein [Oscillospiraceae bacterium]|nr:leucine-rich repeat protein [Oscillospiraceae bacterium]